MSSPPPRSLAPVPSSVPTVWPPSNPSGTVIPFPLPWGQTGCCPPGGMSALMQCYCDLQQASAFIGQVMLDQINNNPAIIAAIIAGIEASGSTLPTLGVTDGSDAQPGQVGELIRLVAQSNYATTPTTTVLSLGVLPPGDWDCWAWTSYTTLVGDAAFLMTPVPAGFSDQMSNGLAVDNSQENLRLLSNTVRASISVPTLIAITTNTNMATAGSAAGTLTLEFYARRRR